jgi:glycosyltransferase involved in cell wall biosynthesis
MIGVNVKRFSPNPEVREELRSELGIPKSTCLFLFVGRLCKDKGIWDVLKAFVHLREKFTDIGLLVVGPDEENVVEQAKEIYGDVLNGVFWIGQTFAPEKYMATADVLVLPSYREGFGSVIIEAASCYLPTIAYRINGVIDAVVDGQTGLLVNKGHLDELQIMMQNLLSDHELRERMGSLAREQACQKFSQEKVTQAWLDFYANLFKPQN